MSHDDDLLTLRRMAKAYREERDAAIARAEQAHWALSAVTAQCAAMREALEQTYRYASAGMTQATFDQVGRALAPDAGRALLAELAALRGALEPLTTGNGSDGLKVLTRCCGGYYPDKGHDCAATRALALGAGRPAEAESLRARIAEMEADGKVLLTRAELAETLLERIFAYEGDALADEVDHVAKTLDALREPPDA